MSENLDSEQRTRLWEYRLHVENQLYSRMTVFLTYETILLAVVGTLYNNPNSARNVLILLVVLGVFITLIWLYVQHNVKQVFVILDFRTYDPHSAVFFENLGEKPFYIAELEISSALQIRSLSDITKNANANCGMWV